MEMTNDVLSSVGAQDMNTSGHQVSDLDDFEVYWENDHLDVDAVFIIAVFDTLLLPTAFEELEMGR